ncbi:MAG: NAD(P)-dependent oxidoreductase [Alphaproteobacteria bacterium]|nr:NAD(P)-dependent oxidoreductase [Alphaproteobacteria bacterium]
MTTPCFETLLLTGSAGRLGTELRRGLAPLAKKLRVSDRTEIKNLLPNEEAVICELSDQHAVEKLTKGVDAIIHFGGAPLERPWQDILDSNIRGSYHVYEGARKNGVKRVVYASSVHAIGYHSREDHIDAHAPHRPDSLYGLSKCFVEDLGQLYWDKFGVESVCLRIFSSFPKPIDHRMLWSWLSFDDCIRLVIASLTAQRVAHTIAFGISDNAVKTVDNRLSQHLGFYPQDNTEQFRAALESSLTPPDPKSLSVQALGGWFVDLGHPDDQKDK